MTAKFDRKFTLLLPGASEQEVNACDLKAAIAEITNRSDAFWVDAAYVNSADQAWISLFRGPGNLGCIVSCCGTSDAIEYFATNNSADHSNMISVRKSGGTEQDRADCFIPIESATGLLCFFADTLERRPESSWVAVGD